ncbi:MAG: 23S rRNA (uracil(1939)-C(5))-methyltransferase RlmD [Pseudomonadota bacterium]
MELRIESMDDQARGIARVDGKVVFVSGALAGERVVAQYTRLRGRYNEARVLEVLDAHDQRVSPRCAHYDDCGGCALQHLEPGAQVALKQERWLDNLRRLGGVVPEQLEPPLTGPVWGYRNRARLGAKFVPKKGGLLVGFRERHGQRLADIHGCEVLHPAVGQRIDLLRERLGELSVNTRLPQVEVAIGEAQEDGTSVHGMLTLRHLEPLTDDDRALLRGLASELGLSFALQPAGPDSIHALEVAVPPGGPDPMLELGYTIDDPDARGAVRMAFEPRDFTQVNADINQQMIAQALIWLAPEELSSVLDLFCGIGNFTLPIARRCGVVAGVEGAAPAIDRAHLNAVRNRLEHCRFEVGDLNDPEVCNQWLSMGFEGLLLDPPRSGAAAVTEALRAGPAASAAPRRIVYVSCSPASLARDLGVLVNECGYRLLRGGIMDMFPHTNHVESMALLERD